MNPNFVAHLARFQQQLKTLRVDAYLLTSPPDLLYVSGYNQDGFYGLVSQDQAWAFVPPLLADQVRQTVHGFTVLVGVKRGQFHDQLRQVLSQRRIRRLAYDPHHVSESLSQELRQNHRKIRWIRTPAVGERLREVKEPGEIGAVREAGRIAVLGVEHLRRHYLQPGIRECELAAEFERFIRQHGASKASFDIIVAAGPNSAFPHYITGDRIVQKNDVVLFDVGCVVHGYCSDLTRTVFLGTIPPQLRKINQIVERAQAAGMAAVRSGVLASQVDRAARKVISQAGYGPQFIHSTGHGVGIEIHESPFVSPTGRTVLQPGMVITV
ncbi:MAG: aminopeptidase P family protein, partial [Elusimicrobia bacterium]|nr:aminopeptidase P family protein [Elusimicrobiota bacterium]